MTRRRCIHNTGDQPLKITGLTLSDTSAWQIVNPPSFPVTVAANTGTLDITVKFIATKNPSHTDNQTDDTATTNGIPSVQAGGVYSGTLTIKTADTSRDVTLSGYWQDQSAHENEPSLQTLTNKLFGYGTNINSTQIPQLTEGSTAVYYGEEYHAASQQGLFAAADTSKPVTVQQIDAFHNQGLTAPRFGTRPAARRRRSSSATSPMRRSRSCRRFREIPTLRSQASRRPGTSASISMASSRKTARTPPMCPASAAAGMRCAYPLRDGSNHLIPNSWLMVMDYQNSEFDNDDFQDLMYVVSNARPAALPATPTNLQASVTGWAALGSGHRRLDWSATTSCEASTAPARRRSRVH